MQLPFAEAAFIIFPMFCFRNRPGFSSFFPGTWKPSPFSKRKLPLACRNVAHGLILPLLIRLNSIHRKMLEVSGHWHVDVSCDGLCPLVVLRRKPDVHLLSCALCVGGRMPDPAVTPSAASMPAPCGAGPPLSPHGQTDAHPLRLHESFAVRCGRLQ